jgi:hypothetical protein
MPQYLLFAYSNHASLSQINQSTILFGKWSFLNKYYYCYTPPYCFLLIKLIWTYFVPNRRNPAFYCYYYKYPLTLQHRLYRKSLIKTKILISCKRWYALHVLFIRFLKETVLYCLGLEPNISKCKHLILGPNKNNSWFQVSNRPVKHMTDHKHFIDISQ